MNEIKKRKKKLNVTLSFIIEEGSEKIANYFVRRLFAIVRKVLKDDLKQDPQITFTIENMD